MSTVNCPNGQADVEWRRLSHVCTTPGARPLRVLIQVVSALDYESAEPASPNIEVGIMTFQRLNSASEVAMTVITVVGILVAIRTVGENES